MIILTDEKKYVNTNVYKDLSETEQESKHEQEGERKRERQFQTDSTLST